MRQSSHSILAIISFSTWKGIVFHFPSPIWDTLLWLKQGANLTGQWQEIFSHRKDLHQIPAAFYKWELSLLPPRTQGQTTAALSTCVNKRKKNLLFGSSLGMEYLQRACGEQAGHSFPTLLLEQRGVKAPEANTCLFHLQPGREPSLLSHIGKSVEITRTSTQVGEAGESALCSWKNGRGT